jgi:hypothetical protein
MAGRSIRTGVGAGLEREVLARRVDVTGVRGRPDIFIGADAPPQVKQVVIADNSQFIDRVNLTQLIDVLHRPTRTLVVSQSPPPGDQVPTGTPITLTLTVKQVIPLGTLGIEATLAQKFPTIGALQDHIDTSANGAALKEVLAKGTAYQDLTPADKGVADGFLNEVGNIPDADRAKAFDDAGFTFNL